MLRLLCIVAEDVWTVHDYLCRNFMFIYLHAALGCYSTVVHFNADQNITFMVKICIQNANR